MFIKTGSIGFLLAVFVFQSSLWSDGTEEDRIDEMRRRGVLFYLPFESSAEAAICVGSGQPWAQQSLSFIPGRIGRALRLKNVPARYVKKTDGSVVKDGSATSTQTAPLDLLLLLMIPIDLFLAWMTRGQVEIIIILVAFAGVVTFIAFSFSHLTVQDEGDAVAIRYWPLPVFNKLVPYVEMMSDEAGRSLIIDGWDIHYVSCRVGLITFGVSTARSFTFGNGSFCIGLIDVDNLTAFLQSKIKDTSPGGHDDS